MLALALGVVVTAGIVTLFVGNNQTYTLLNGQSRMQENARFAVDFISRSARAAGYFGCDPEQGKIYKTLNGAWNQIFEFDITTPIQAFHGTAAGNTVNDWTPSLTTLPRVGSVVGYVAANGVDITKLQQRSDILVLRHVQIPGRGSRQSSTDANRRWKCRGGPSSRPETSSPSITANRRRCFERTSPRRYRDTETPLRRWSGSVSERTA